jgi:hypothetical protein
MNDQEIEYESWNVCRIGSWIAVQYREKQPDLPQEEVEAQDNTEQQ